MGKGQPGGAPSSVFPPLLATLGLGLGGFRARTGGGVGEVPIRGEAWVDQPMASSEKKVGCGTSTEHLLLEENLVLLTRPKPISIR